MYKIDPKYIKQIDLNGDLYFVTPKGEITAKLAYTTGECKNLNDDDRAVVYDQIGKLELASHELGVPLYFARYNTGKIKQERGMGRYDRLLPEDVHNYAILTEDGCEIAKYHDSYKYGHSIEGYVTYRAKGGVAFDMSSFDRDGLCNVIAKHAIEDKEIVEALPAKLFEAVEPYISDLLDKEAEEEKQTEQTNEKKTALLDRIK